MTGPGPTRRPRARLADVASLARVDPSVVTRVISGDDRLVIKDETRQRITDAIRELRYQPNPAVRSLRTGQSGPLGLLIPDFANPIYAAIIKGAEQAATEAGALLLTGTASADRPERYIELLASGRVEGLLLAADALDPATIGAMLATGRPVVSVNQRLPGVPRAILADDERASGVAVAHLVALGHERIAHLRGPARSDTAKRRLAGYRRALRTAGIRPDAALELDTESTTEAGAEAMTRLLESRPRPTAVVVGTVAAAIGALSAARLLGIQIPEEVSVVAIHDIPLAANLYPPLTTVRMPLAEMGREGVLALFATNGDRAGQIVVREPTELIVRESTAPVGRSD